MAQLKTPLVRYDMKLDHETAEDLALARASIEEWRGSQDDSLRLRVRSALNKSLRTAQF